MAKSLDDVVASTEELISKVVALTDVLVIQTDEIAKVREDLDTKASRESVKGTSRLIALLVIVATLTSGAFSYGFSYQRTQDESRDRKSTGLKSCLATNLRNNINVTTFRDFAKELPEGSRPRYILEVAANNLAMQNRDCVNIYK